MEAISQAHDAQLLPRAHESSSALQVGRRVGGVGWGGVDLLYVLQNVWKTKM